MDHGINLFELKKVRSKYLKQGSCIYKIREFNRANHTRSLIDSNQCSSAICWARSKLSSVDRLVDRSKFIIRAKVSIGKSGFFF